MEERKDMETRERGLTEVSGIELRRDTLNFGGSIMGAPIGHALDAIDDDDFDLISNLSKAKTTELASSVIKDAPKLRESISVQRSKPEEPMSDPLADLKPDFDKFEELAKSQIDDTVLGRGTI